MDKHLRILPEVSALLLELDGILQRFRIQAEHLAREQQRQQQQQGAEQQTKAVDAFFDNVLSRVEAAFRTAPCLFSSEARARIVILLFDPSAYLASPSILSARSPEQGVRTLKAYRKMWVDATRASGEFSDVKVRLWFEVKDFYCYDRFWPEALNAIQHIYLHMSSNNVALLHQHEDFHIMDVVYRKLLGLPAA